MRSRFAAELAAAGAVVAALCLVSMAEAAPGDLDPSFGTGGIASTLMGVQSVATQSDGSVIEGASSAFAVARLTPAGKTDTSFGNGGGTVIDAPGNFERLSSVAVGPDDRIAVVGSTEIGYPNHDGVLAVLRPDGHLDPSFSGDGIETFDFGGSDALVSVAFDPDGRIVVAGTSQETSTYKGTPFVARFEPDGDPDPTFSGDGIEVQPDGLSGTSELAEALAVQPDGKILLEENAQLESDTYWNHPRVIRLRADGTLDPGYSGDGIAELPFVGYVNYLDLALDGSGKSYFLAGGPYDDLGPAQVIARLDASGELDPAFSGDGYEYTDTRAVAGGEIDDQGRLLFSGYAVLGAGHEVDIDLRRLTPAGDPDPSFSGDGSVTTDVSGWGSYDEPNALTLDRQGRIVVAAYSDGSRLVRYLSAAGPPDADADGVLDPDDVCPARFGRDDRGCRLYEPSLTLEYDRRIDDFTGTINYGPVRTCVDGAVVRVYRKRHAKDKVIGRSQPTSDHPGVYPEPETDRHWGVSALRRPGRYYATAKPRTLPDTGVCAAGRSTTLKLKRKHHRHRHAGNG